MTVSMLRRASRAFEVRSKYSDSGVVMTMSAGSRWKRARSLAGVSPVRTRTDGTRCGSPRRAASLAMPAMGARRLRSMSTASAFSGDTYSTRQRAAGAGGGENINRFRHHRNAASVFPLPVGASTSVDAPPAIAFQPLTCAGVGSWNERVNHSLTAGWNGSKATDRS